MHPFEMPKEYVDRMVERQGRPHTCETFDGPKTALVVVDMQIYFMEEGQLGAAPVAQEIVPNVNRLAEAVRERRGAGDLAAEPRDAGVARQLVGRT